jgi:transcriptional regulator with XRE-family HTH domain
MTVRTLGERIRRERITWGMTQEDLADATGIARDKIAKIETGRRQVDAGELPLFARVFDLAVEDLVNEPRPVVYHRLDATRPETQEARTWFDECIDSSLFVRRLVGFNAR